MLWFTVWSVLVLATLAGAVVLGRGLWRKGRALLAELERAADVAGRLADRADELTAAAAATAPGHDLLTDPQQHRERLDAIHARRDRRRAERQARHTRTFTRWQSVSR